MPCNLNLSHDEKMMTTPVLYWYYNSTVKIVPITDEYKERAHILDNTSMLLKNVTWADSGNYRCKLSITLEKDKSFRKNGSGSLLIVYGKYKVLFFFVFFVFFGVSNVFL